MSEHAKDWAEAHLNGDDIRASADREWARANKIHPQPEWQTRIFTASDLQRETFAPIKHIVPGIVTEGLNMLAGRPKFGKSWLALEIAIATAIGGTCLGGIEVEKGDVLYAACEDSKRRLQSRMTRLLGATELKWPENLTLTTGWRRLDQGGVSDLAEWLKSAKNPRLIILDTLASVKPIRAINGYQEEYAALESLHRLANDTGVAILILHHEGKSEAEDPLDTISGTLGLAGCVDTPVIVAGTPQGKTLYVRGRDVEEAEHAITFNKETCRWSITGEAVEVHRSETRNKILAVLKTARELMGPSDIAAAADLKENVVKQRLHFMVPDGEVVRVGRGLYHHPENPITSITSSPSEKGARKNN